MTLIAPILTFILGLILGYSIIPIKAYFRKIHDRYIERQWAKHIAKMELQGYQEAVHKAAEKIIDRELQKAHIVWLSNQNA